MGVQIMKKMLILLLALSACLLSTEIYSKDYLSDRSHPVKDIKGIIATQQATWETSGLKEAILTLYHRQGQFPKSMKSVTASMTEVVYKDWEGNAWVNSEKDQLFYGENGFQFKSYGFIWEEGQWEHVSWTEITNNGEGNPTGMVMKIWDGGSWIDMLMVTITYTPQGYMHEIIMSFYFETMWLDIMKVLFSYDAQGLNSEVLTQMWDMMSSGWVNSNRSTFVYNANGWMIEELSQVWEEDEWVNSEIALNTYDSNGNETEKLLKSWDNNTWENWLFYTYTYNAQWYQIQEKTEYWDGTGWVNFELLTFQYDAQGRISQELSQAWQSGWVNNFLTTWVYDLSIGINEPEMAGTFFKLSPNPSSGIIYIRFLEDPGTSVSVQIYSLEGALVKSFVNQSHNQPGQVHKFSINDLPVGVYFISLRTQNGFNAIEKVVTIR